MANYLLETKEDGFNSSSNIWDYMWPDSVENPFYSTSVFSSQSAGSVDLTEILLASRRATLHDFMALSYGPARALAYDRRRGFSAWVECDDNRYGRNFV